MTALLMSCAVKATVLLAVAWPIAFAIRRQPAAVRHLVWMGLFPALLLLPAAALLVPPLSVPAVGAASILLTTGVGTPASEAGGWGLEWLPAIWLAGVILFGTVLAAGAMRLSRLRGAAAFLRLDGRTRIYLSPRVRIPITWGVRRPVVILPAEAVEWPAGRMDAVLAHELGHVRQMDWATLAIAHAACAVYWFHPLVWLAIQRLRRDSELACDDGVLSLGIRGTEYARHLVEIAREASISDKEVRVMAIPMAGSSNLEQRVLSILDPSVRRACFSRKALALAVVAALVAVIPLSALQSSDRKAEIREAVKIDKDKDKDVVKPTLIKKVEPIYPPDMKEQKIEDSVKMQIVISKEGKVIDVRRAGTSANEAFYKAAEAALVQWEFQPARKAGHPLIVIADVEINFRLN